MAISDKYPPWITLPKNVRILIFTQAGRSRNILEAHQNFEKYKNDEMKPCSMYTGGEQCPNFKLYYSDQYFEHEGE